jgi:protein ImuB
VALAGLIDRLQNRLGPNRVVQLVPVESHVPEWAEIQKSAHAPLPSRSAGSSRSGKVRGLFVSSLLKAVRPLTLLPIPEPIEAIAPVPDDPPLSFLWHKVRYRVAFADGPERIGPEWWLPVKARPRDYYRVEDVAGRRFWLYREGLYGAAEPPRWFLHGFFP